MKESSRLQVQSLILSSSEEGREVAEDQTIEHEGLSSLMFDTVLGFVLVRQHVPTKEVVEACLIKRSNGVSHGDHDCNCD